MVPANTQTQTPTQKMSGLFSQLRQDILSGRISPGSQLPSERQLSDQYGVAPATAAGVVSRLANEGLAVRISRRGTFVRDKLPVQLKLVDLVRIKTAPGTAEKPSLVVWIEKLSEACQEQGYKACWHHLDEDEPLDSKRLAERFDHSRGVVILRYAPEQLPLTLYQNGIPVVGLFSAMSATGMLPSSLYPRMTYDRIGTAHTAVEHLASLGYTRIGLVWLRSSPAYVSGYVDVLHSRKLPMSPEWITTLEKDVSLSYKLTNGSFSETAKIFREYLAGANRPEAICCPSEDLAYIVEYAAEELSLKVPDDLAIVACGGNRQYIPGKASVTTVAVSKTESCRRALKLMEQVRSRPEGDNRQLWDPIVMPVHLTVKDSCGARLKDPTIPTARPAKVGEKVP